MNPWDHTILLVDDEPDGALLLKQAFEKAGVKNPVQILCNGQEAIDYLTRQGSFANAPGTRAAPALMLLDLKMPRKTGFEVLEWLRTQPGLKRLVVIVMATSIDRREISRAYQLGCNSFLVKPVSFERLVEMAKAINSYWLLLNEKPDMCVSSQ